MGYFLVLVSHFPTLASLSRSTKLFSKQRLVPAANTDSATLALLCLPYHGNSAMPALSCLHYHANSAMPTLPCLPYHANSATPALPCLPYHANSAMPALPFCPAMSTPPCLPRHACSTVPTICFYHTDEKSDKYTDTLLKVLCVDATA